LLSADNARQWAYNTGSNKNAKGNQKTGSVRIGNQAESAVSSGVNTGGNINLGEFQQTGDIEIGNQTNPSTVRKRESEALKLEVTSTKARATRE